MNELGSGAAGLALATWIAGCALITPVDEIQTDAPTAACRGADCKDAGLGESRPHSDKPAQPAAILDASMSTRADAEPEDAGGAAVPACVVPVGADCNPVDRCGCGADSECDVDLEQERVRCVPRHKGSGREGEACVEPGDCASGLQCNDVKVCARYCRSDEACSGKGKCLEYRVLSSGIRIAGSGTCSRWCDPLRGSECLPTTACYAAGETDTDPSATCRAFYDEGRKPRGAACEWYNECEARLACAEFGPTICTSFCRSDSDCPAQTPHCFTDFTNHLLESPGHVIGQCVAWPCDEATLGDPRVWSEGPIWSADQHADCIRRCGDSSPDCARMRCTDGTRWRQCWDTTLAACAGAKGAACRDKYVAFTCSEFDKRTIPRNAFSDCAKAQADCLVVAKQTCAEPF